MHGLGVECAMVQCITLGESNKNQIVFVHVDCKRYLKPTSVDSQGQHSSIYVFSVFVFVCQCVLN